MPSDAPEARPAALETELSVRAGHRFTPRLVSAVPSGLARVAPGLLRSVAVVGGGSDVAQAVTAALSGAGYPAQLRTLPEPGDDGLVLLHGLQSVESEGQALTILQDAFRAVRAASSLFGDAPGLLVSIQDTGGGLALERPPSALRAPLAGLSGLIKTADLEAPAAVCFSLDVAAEERSPDAVAKLLLSELSAGGLEREVAYDGAGTRYTLAAAEVPVDPSRGPVFEADDVVVATGGARGVTAQCLKQLAQTVPARFALLGRTELEDEDPETRSADGEADIKRALVDAHRKRGQRPDPAELGALTRKILAGREVRRTLRDLEASGSQAVYLTADASDPDQLRAAFDEIRNRWGPPAGIIHGAGVIQDKRIVDKTDDQVERVLRTKVSGLQGLLTVTRDDPLKAVVAFSSVAAHSGNVGQSDYAMANAAVDALAVSEANRRPSAVVKSLAWGPWRGGMVSPALEARFQEAGVPLIGLEDGARWMLEELQTSDACRVILGGEPRPAPLLPGTRAKGMALHIGLDPERHPELSDHAVDGPPVVPVVMVLNWMVDALRGLLPGHEVLAIENLRVKRGISVEQWPDAGVALEVQATPVSDGFELHLRDRDGLIRYSATGRALPALPSAPSRAEGLPPSSEPRPYGGVLFHGPRFQALSPLEARGKDGAQGQLMDAEGLGWVPNPNRRTDPARLDGALQLAVLVTEDLIGGASLPTQIRRVSFDTEARAPGAGLAWSVTRERSSDQAIHDAAIHDGAGRLSAVIEGLETTRRPGWKPRQ